MLKDLTDIQKLYREKLDEKHYYQQRWSTWNRWASTQPWYHKWAYDNAFEPKDLKAKEKYNVPIEYDMIEGAPLKTHLLILEHDLDLIRQKRSDILKRLWFDHNNGRYTYKIQEIADAYGCNLSYIFRILSKEPWYKARKHDIQNNA